ncbi:AAA family ATPase [Colibacter massiliensis]|uniref:AAA family ATPase n=1 Tax=Colibacter massiliensis TaxID=1852379 RepID=UPI0023568D3C|nr:AAA family ATPase [Colibacter massiliensis]
MKIIQMNLDDFGIYHNVMWNPPERGLIVIHGRNESGKTTLMKYVRSMFFGYLRGEWKGCFGHMDIRRENGREYRIYRNEKESYIADGDMLIHEEPAALWWHDLERTTYDKIFAVGLEDLQGFKILSNESVRSHFFSIESGVRMGVTSRDLQRLMGELFVASPQGKKPINMLLSAQHDVDLQIDRLAYDEEEFAALQGEENGTHEEERKVRLEIEEYKQQLERTAMPITAWNVYKRGQEARRYMQELADVAQFPADGAQRFTELEDKITLYDEQIRELKRNRSEASGFKDEWNHWFAAAAQIEELHEQLPQWRQDCAKLAENADSGRDRQLDKNRATRQLREWLDGAVPTAVDWESGLTVAMNLEQQTRGEEKWRAAKPTLPDTAQVPAINEPVRTKTQWQELGKNLASAQEILLERKKTAELLAWVQAEPEQHAYGFAALAVLCVTAAVALCYAATAYALAVIYAGAAAAFAGAGAFFYKYRQATTRKSKRSLALEADMERINKKLDTFAKNYGLTSCGGDDNETWQHGLEGLRKEYLDWQTRSTRESWEREQQDMYQAMYTKWSREGEAWAERIGKIRGEWQAWQQQSGFIRLQADRLTEAKTIWEQWQRLDREEKAWEAERAVLEQRVGRIADKGEQLFREISIKKALTPAAMEDVYKEWQHIQVQAEVAKEQERQRKEEQARLDALEKEKQIRLDRQQEVLRQANCHSAGEFRNKVLQYRRFCQYKEVYEQSEAHIRLIAKSPKNFSALQRELKTRNLKDWQDEQAAYEERIAACERKLAAIAERRGSVVERLSAMAKSDTGEKLLQKKQALRADLDRDVDDWLTYLYAQYMLREAQSYYERVRQPVVIRKAGEYLSLMTGGRYTLQATFDGRQLFAVDGMQRRIPEKQWSSGLGDQIYLAVRVSLAVAFSHQIEPMPLILDDILVRFDEERQKEALRFLADMGKEEQIFLFTCSEETRRLAEVVRGELAGETDTVHVFEISKGTIQAAAE